MTKCSKHFARSLALLLALLLLVSAVPGTAGFAQDLLSAAVGASEPDVYAIPYWPMAENDAVPMPMEELRAIAVARSSAEELVDTDGDGIPDDWEIYGVDYNGDGIIDLDLPAMGADPLVPDIFVEVDWMEGLHDVTEYTNLSDIFGAAEKTRQEIFDLTAEEYAKHGINLHIDFGPGSIDYVTGIAWDDYPGGAGGNEFPYRTDWRLGYSITMNALSDMHLTYLRTPVFYHCTLVSLEVLDGDWGGVAERPGMRTLLTRGGAFMHELGHNLGLAHGGWDDDTNQKPNYLSCMNYGYQGSDFLYSDYQLPDLDENNLSEPDGVDPFSQTIAMGPAAETSYRKDGITYLVLMSVAGKALDYNQNGVATDTGVVQDINGDGQLTVLKGKEDWSHLQLNNPAVGSLHGLKMRTIAYDANGGTGAPDSQLKLKGQDVILRTGEPTSGTDIFSGWSTSSTGAVEYLSGGTYSVDPTADVTLYAVWQSKVAPGITGSTTMTLTEGYTATASDAFTVTGNPVPAVTATGDPNITWNAGTKKLDIAAGLVAGEYSVELTASNGFGTDATVIFTLTVDPAPDTVINLASIAGVTAPAYGGTPVTTITETTQYTGSVTWSPTIVGAFAASTAYTATVTLTPKTGYTLTGVAANYFTVVGATATNPANSGVITAVFPATGSAPTADKTVLNARIAAIGGTQKGNYTDASWNAFQNALMAAQNVANNVSATQTQVNDALYALNSAYSNLQSKKMIFTTRYESNFLNWILFFLCFGFIWMWFI